MSNTVKRYLKESGRWDTPITVDRGGHACFGGEYWGMRMFSDWIDAGFYGEVDEDGVVVEHHEPRLESGRWVRDQHGTHWWLTDTPEWDRQWFVRNGVKPPRHFADEQYTQWTDFGGGLYRMDYHNPRPSLWRRLCDVVSGAIKR